MNSGDRVNSFESIKGSLAEDIFCLSRYPRVLSKFKHNLAFTQTVKFEVTVSGEKQTTPISGDPTEGDKICEAPLPTPHPLSCVSSWCKYQRIQWSEIPTTGAGEEKDPSTPTYLLTLS